MQFAAIYAYFANQAGIATRIVSTYNGHTKGLPLTEHTFAESYIAAKNQWAFVDLTSGKIGVANAAGDWLNAIDVFHVNQSKTYRGLRAITFSDGDLRDVPYETAMASEQFYFGRDTSFIFHRKWPLSATPWLNKIQKGLKTVVQPHVVYSLRGTSVYHLMRLYFWAQMVVVAIWCMLLVKYIARRVAPRRII